MAKRYGVSRTTIRGALHGLAARGLIVKHPGRQSRTVGLDQALTLESLKLALPEEGREDPARRRLLEGFFSLKREVTVELLAACCEHASKEDLEELVGACFALREEAHWQEDRRGWVHQEFELLRLAARAADRPGHALLIQSLEKAFQGLADRVLPHLDAAAIEQWALFAFNALVERDAQALRQELPALAEGGGCAAARPARSGPQAPPHPRLHLRPNPHPRPWRRRPCRARTGRTGMLVIPVRNRRGRREGLSPRQVAPLSVPEPGFSGPEGSPVVPVPSHGQGASPRDEAAPGSAPKSMDG